eukprot:14488482-Heterocapsa_arctica.AAC.1
MGTLRAMQTGTLRAIPNRDVALQQKMRHRRAMQTPGGAQARNANGDPAQQQKRRLERPQARNANRDPAQRAGGAQARNANRDPAQKLRHLVTKPIRRPALARALPEAIGRVCPECKASLR